MERLILEVDVGDGFEYSGQDHIPVVFSSKEEFLISLEGKLKEILEKLPSVEAEFESCSQKFQELAIAVRKKKNPSEKEQIEFSELFIKSHKEYRMKNAAVTELEKFSLGGHQFNYGDFVNTTFDKHNKPIRTICLPTVYTLDEFFAQAEFNINNEEQQKSKVKP